MEKEYDALSDRMMIAIRQVKSNKRPSENEANSKYFPLLTGCWKSNPGERLRIEDVVRSLEDIRKMGRYKPRRT